ncbi:alpha-amylase family protein [Carboxylicivirga linearis]|uniref:Alpha-amylase family protein n=1 Tax=Carboxylicivirga linearis TaxID=1628157 RepID=A0ABS5JUJ9_9BACT|nr:alpha-amylase family protein [Carboxylicivirga linearis]MBS2098513.1 alpha-amylase family protein [Carboxylicivirga linearis]
MGKAIIYQVLPRLFGNLRSDNIKRGNIQENGSGKLNGFDDRILQHFKDMGITHMWYTGVIEHATATDYTEYNIVNDNSQVVKGEAGSPYAIKDYYDIDPDLAENVDKRMLEFEALVERTHSAGMKVLIDFIPNHLARNYHSDNKPEGVKDFGENDDVSKSFHPNNNFYYLKGQSFNAPLHSDDPWQEEPAKATGNDCFSPTPSVNDWYETVKLNYGVDVEGGNHNYFDPIPDIWLKMKEVLLYWCSKGVDGFRCDMAEMVPVEFWHWCIKMVKEQYPKTVFVAEVYQPSLYNSFLMEGGFDCLYDKVGFYDSVIGVIKHNQSLKSIIESWQAIDQFSDNMLFFLENHDEQRLASDFIIGEGKKAWPAWVITAAYATNPIMIYSGQELGEKGMEEEGFSGINGRTTIFDYWSVDSLRRYYLSIKGNDGLKEEEQWLLERYKRLNNLLNSHMPLKEGGVYDLMWCNNSPGGLTDQRVYAWLRFYKHQWMLLVANLSDKTQNCRIIIPEHAFKMEGADHLQYFKGREILEESRSIQFPKEVAITNGVGVKVEAYQALIYLFG